MVSTSTLAGRVGDRMSRQMAIVSYLVTSTVSGSMSSAAGMTSVSAGSVSLPLGSHEVHNSILTPKTGPVAKVEKGVVNLQKSLGLYPSQKSFLF
jgi:hypothetical protein